jgi:A/G-specific adenine glycosylase
VLSRYYGIEEDISKNKTVNSIRTIAQEILPEDKPWIFAEALIELGATICQKKANCAMCPLASTCQAFKLGKADKLPYKSTKTTIEKLYRTTLVLTCNNQILVKKVPDGEIMAGLYEFPYLETTQKGMTPQIITKKMKADWNIEASFLKALPLVRHSFTRYQAHLFPMVFDCSECFSIPKCQWLPLNIAYQLPFSSGHKRVLETIKTSMTLHTTNRKAP